MKKHSGMTLIEVVVFIVVLGITAAGSLTAMRTILTNSSQPGKILAAAQLAQARMAIILQQAVVNGFSNINDPCNLTTPPAACTGLATFASNKGYTLSSSILAASGGVITASVTVSGAGNAILVTRFVQ